LRRKHRALPAEKFNAQKRRKNVIAAQNKERAKSKCALETSGDYAPSAPFLRNNAEPENFRKKHGLECRYCEWQREGKLDRRSSVVMHAKMVVIFPTRQLFVREEFCHGKSERNQESQKLFSTSRTLSASTTKIRP
jgi:hypothetical protein